ncbi:MAG: hypothetical protein NNA30_01290 [Nitrospira sp.]|nr:hypothetical protein [Nitrospira sp.]
MSSTKMIVVIGSLVLVVVGGGLGAWMASTAPPDNLEPWKEQQCNEYVTQLERVNQYKMFWSFVQRRVAFNDCLSRIEETGGKPTGGAHP